mmetsp:Transcript_85858/g.148683  ORF Transcript_85858/g.148683 Transcript_85858/m.148683 type:complete len:158 (+) Transcript_85858:53-526(+)
MAMTAGMTMVDAEDFRKILKEMGSISIRVRNPCGVTSMYEVSPKDTVAELKKQIEAQDGIPTKEQRLLSDAVLMVDERTLGSYRLRNQSVLKMVSTLRSVEKAGIEKAASAKRGFLMTPGLDAPWKPNHASKLDMDQSEGFFDSSLLPAPWKVSRPL